MIANTSVILDLSTSTDSTLTIPYWGDRACRESIARRQKVASLDQQSGRRSRLERICVEAGERLPSEWLLHRRSSQAVQAFESGGLLFLRSLSPFADSGWTRETVPFQANIGTTITMATTSEAGEAPGRVGDTRLQISFSATPPADPPTPVPLMGGLARMVLSIGMVLLSTTARPESRATSYNQWC
jgi:hypothetical protein